MSAEPVLDAVPQKAKVALLFSSIGEDISRRIASRLTERERMLVTEGFELLDEIPNDLEDSILEEFGHRLKVSTCPVPGLGADPARRISGGTEQPQVQEATL